MSQGPKAYLGDILHFFGAPDATAINGEHTEFITDGMLVTEDGHVTAVGKANDLKASLHPDTSIIDHRQRLIVPGFVDTHVHYPQCEVIASHGAQLIDWLENYTYPAESKFQSKSHASAQASFFLDELLRNGTTTALVFGTVHPESVDAFFQEAESRKLRMICGKVMMDRNAPDNLRDTPESSYQDSRALIEKWHDKGRLGYAVTPRFAPTSSPEQLSYAGQLLNEYPEVHLHTHLSENKEECAWVAKLYPDCKNYLDVYDRFNLLGRQSVFAHAIHLSTSEWQRLAHTQSNVAHCPTSNLFIGSGLFNLQKANSHDVRVGFGTDIGGGDSFSLLRVINEAYKIQQLQNYSLDPLQALYHATLGGAEVLNLHNRIGNFEKGKEADFIVLDHTSTALVANRTKTASSLEEKLFALMMLGDDRTVSHTYVMGEERKNALTTH